MSIWRWAGQWDSPPAEARLSLGEGDTPLVRSHQIGPAAGLRNLFFKLETATPTGSYKDRFTALAVSRPARHLGLIVFTSQVLPRVSRLWVAAKGGNPTRGRGY